MVSAVHVQKCSIVARAVSNSRMILSDDCIPVLASGLTSYCPVDTHVNHWEQMLYMKMHVREIYNGSISNISPISKSLKIRSF